MRARTVKRLAILIAVILLTGGSAYAVWRLQIGKMAQGVVEQADRAVAKNNLIEAADLYQQHLMVFPTDQVVQLKYADVLAKLPAVRKNLENALTIYFSILNEEPGRHDVRRRAAELAISMNAFQMARSQLLILLKSAPEDGHLEFLMGQCYQEDNDPENAARNYRNAIEHGTPDRLEASERLAALIRRNEKLGTPEDADKVIDDIVKADPGNSRVYLARGHYRHLFHLAGAEEDLRKSLQLDHDQPATYLELAQLAERSTELEQVRHVLEAHRPFTFLLPTAMDVACQILDNGLAAAPNSPLLYQARADLERKAGRIDRFIELLESGVKAMPEQMVLRWQLAQVLAAHGDTGKLLLQIEELKDLGINKALTDYLTAYYYANNKEFDRAKKILTSIQAGVAQGPELKSMVNVLLARCHGRLHEPELEWEANQRAINANPDDVKTQEQWINAVISRLVKQGKYDEAIKEYQQLMKRSPRLDRRPLLQLMLVRNRLRPPAQRDWREAEELLDEVAKAAPDSIEPVVLRAILLAEQDQQEKGRRVLETARLRFPEAIEPWIAEAEILMRQKKFDEALGRLDSAQKRFGDRVELRNSRAMIWAGNGAPREEVVKVLNGLARDLDSFPKEKRRGLLAYLASQLTAQQDIEGAERVWSRLAEDDPDDVNPHLQLVDLAFRVASTAETDKQVEAKAKAKAEAEIEVQIKAIERLDPTYGHYCRARYLTWRASRSQDEAEGKRLRAEARTLLAEVKSRRDEWDQIPLTEAALLEQELAQKGLDDAAKREKQEALINSNLRAIELGSRDPNVVRRTVALLLTTGRGSEAIQLFGRVPAATQLGGDLSQVVAQTAIVQNDQQSDEVIRKAEEIARKAVAANPANFKERLWLVQILLYGNHSAEAEAELRLGVAQAEGDPEPWRTLIFFLLDTKQLPKAEQALRDAEKKLSQAPLTLAECSARIGRANAELNRVAAAEKWYGEARQWSEKALAAQKNPKDLTSTRRSLVAFFQRTLPVEAEKQLKEILREEASSGDADVFAWARRTLAMIFVEGNRPIEALALFDMAGPKNAVDKPEDQRVRAKVFAAQRDPRYSRMAIEILESMVAGKPAAEDVHLLAQVEESAGNWPRSRELYRKLIELTNQPGDPAGRKQQITCLGEFAERLLQVHQPAEDRDKDLAEAQEQIEQLRRLRPDATLPLEVALYASRNNLEGAAALIRSAAERPNLNPGVLGQLASLAEKIGQFDEFKLAEELYRKIASLPGAPFRPNKGMLIQFLARRQRFPEILELGESLRKNASDRGSVDILCATIFANPNAPASPEQIQRVVGWLEKEVRSGQEAVLYQCSLGNLYERLSQYGEAEKHYRAVIANDPDGLASNNLAWLMTLNGGNLSVARSLIEKAISLKGPHPDFLDTRGVVFLSTGESERAIEDLVAAIAVQPSAAKYFHLAQAYLKKKDKANARMNLELARTKGLPNGLHRLEMPTYQKVLEELGQ